MTDRVTVRIPILGCLVWLFAAALLIGVGLHLGGRLLDWVATL